MNLVLFVEHLTIVVGFVAVFGLTFFVFWSAYMKEEK